MKFTESIRENMKFLLKAVAPNKNNGTHSLKNQLIFLNESQFQGTHLTQLKVYLCPRFWDHQLQQKSRPRPRKVLHTFQGKIILGFFFF